MAEKKIRISDLAKEIGKDPKEVLAVLKGMGLRVKTTASSITEDESKKAKELILKDTKPAVKVEAPVDIKVDQKKEEAAPIQEKKIISIPKGITVKDLADLFQKKPGEVIKELMKLKILATINQGVDINIARQVAEVFGYAVEEKEIEEKKDHAKAEHKEDIKHLLPRPPIVVVMGHVDHGKTKLLDAIRKTNVMDSEAGGITQHIGAYQVEIKGKKITFLDTPGHAAFTALRARGAKVTDIAVLVVAADDGVMPQTVEAIDHAKAAGVPIIVALNKTDKPEADTERVKKQLMEYELVPEEWGGKTVMVAISAKQGKGIDELLEMILLTAEVLELKANPNRSATGIVIEAKLDKGRGPVATVLIGNGTLKVGDTFYTGSVSGKVRALFNDKRESLKMALPSQPVEVLGSESVPVPGEVFRVVHDDQTARKLAEKKQFEENDAKSAKGKVMSLEDFARNVKDGGRKELNLVLKADVQGSLEAIKGLLNNLSTADVRVNIIHSAAGSISDSDIILALASKAIVIGFNVSYEGGAKIFADDKGVDTRLYNIIYQITDDIKAAMSGLLEPMRTEAIIGHAMVKSLFSYSKVGVIAGCIVKDGKMHRGAFIRIIRGNKVIHEGRLDSLKRFKDDAKEVAEGYECGISLHGYTDFVEGDTIECYEIRTEARKV